MENFEAKFWLCKIGFAITLSMKISNEILFVYYTEKTNFFFFSMELDPKKSIPAFYAGRSIFITGATGFMGKALIEKLLRSCPNVGNIFLLMRPKKNISIDDRLRKMLTSPVSFLRLFINYLQFRHYLTIRSRSVDDNFFIFFTIGYIKVTFKKQRPNRFYSVSEIWSNFLLRNIKFFKSENLFTLRLGTNFFFFFLIWCFWNNKLFHISQMHA